MRKSNGREKSFGMGRDLGYVSRWVVMSAFPIGEFGGCRSQRVAHLGFAVSHTALRRFSRDQIRYARNQMYARDSRELRLVRI